MSRTTTALRAGLTQGLIELRRSFSGCQLFAQLLCRW